MMASRGKSERLQYQLLFRVDPHQFPTPDDRDYAVSKARAHYLKTGASIPGVQIVVRWRNPDNHNPLHADWKTSEDAGQSLFGVWKTLGKGRGALR
jgi:hypothetical protein